MTWVRSIHFSLYVKILFTYNVAIYFIEGLNRSVGIETRYRLDCPGIESQVRRDCRYP
jgi:hypothetical protein